MIVVDSSPLIAIIEGEGDAGGFETAIAHADRLVLGAANKLEVMMVIGGRYGRDGIQAAQSLLDRSGVEIVALTGALADAAAAAFLRYGKGRHRAALNFGDCMAYALATSLDAPLLYQGGDFALTDVKAAL